MLQQYVFSLFFDVIAEQQGKSFQWALLRDGKQHVSSETGATMPQGTWMPCEDDIDDIGYARLLEKVA